MRKIWVIVLLALVGGNGCAMLRPTDRPDPGAELELGLAALAAGDYARANAHLYPLYRSHWEQPVGQRALLALIAAEIDPRNPDRRLWSTQDMAERYMQIADAPEWTHPVAESFYMLAAELGAAEERVARAEAERARAEREAAAAQRQSPPAARRSLELPGPTVPQQVGAITRERDELRQRVQQLQNEVSQRDRQIRERDQELERIRRTIRG
jgi:hypothetical protein